MRAHLYSNARICIRWIQWYGRKIAAHRLPVYFQATQSSACILDYDIQKVLGDLEELGGI